MPEKFSNNSGQSIIEILIALTVGSIFIIGAATIITPSLRSSAQANKVQVSSALGRGLLDNVRVFSESDWHNIYNLATSSANKYYLTTSTSPFTAVTGTESVVFATTTYIRYFYLDSVGRDGSGNILSSGGTNDPSTEKVTVVYGWTNGVTSSFPTYLTRHSNKVFDQTDWSGGPGQEGPATTTNNMFSTSTQINYSSSTGSISIQF
ncbi:MAG: prepilin-type N-terminal cleavage/methylation domain-containing protein [Candidatus Liptonbacteria bacterium]|nr:prepilin-type N-terminal cleavage/methylation domain-containing protein [Candidatus Liptonbacteria bacterium]